jgi:hypothetical protein
VNNKIKRLKIKLTKSGGFVGAQMSASTDWEFSEADWKELLKSIERKPGASGMRDAFSYSLGKAGDEHSTPVSIQNIPEKYRAVFKRDIK